MVVLVINGQKGEGVLNSLNHQMLPKLIIVVQVLYYRFLRGFLGVLWVVDRWDKWVVYALGHKLCLE